MRINDVLETYRSIVLLANGHVTMSHVEKLLGDRDHTLTTMLFTSELFKPDGKPSELVTVAEIVDCILLWLALRPR